jgi:hypothetical protein
MSESRNGGFSLLRLPAALAAGAVKAIGGLMCQMFRSGVGGAAAALSQFAVLWILNEHFKPVQTILEALNS